MTSRPIATMAASSGSAMSGSRLYDESSSRTGACRRDWDGNAESWCACQAMVSPIRQSATGTHDWRATMGCRCPRQRRQTSQKRKGQTTSRLKPAGRTVIARPQASAETAAQRHDARWLARAMLPVMRDTSEMKMDSVRM